MLAGEQLRFGLFKLRFRALGSPCLIQFRADNVEAAKAFRKNVLGWITRFEETWSRFKPDSLLSRINRAAGRQAIELAPEDEAVLAICNRAFELSGGLNDPTTLPLTRMWDVAAARGILPGDREITECLQLVGWNKIIREPGRIFLPDAGMALDLGGCGKEYAVDQAMQIAFQFGIRDVLVDLGRDIATSGNPPDTAFWVVGIENPHTPDQGIIRLRLRGQAVASSGGTRRFRTIGGVNYSHHIDPRDGRPAATGVIAASCIAGDCLTAGVFSRSACLLEPEAGLAAMQNFPGVEGLVQTARSVLLTKNFYHHALPL